MQEAVSETAAANAAATYSLLAKLQLPARTLSSLSCGCASERQLITWCTPDMGMNLWGESPL